MKVEFVWLQGNHGPSPQRWYGSHKREKEDAAILFRRVLDDDTLTLDELIALYPAPEVK